MHLRSVLLLLDRVFCLCLTELVHCVKPFVSLYIFCFTVISIIDSEVLKFPALIVQLFLPSILSTCALYVLRSVIRCINVYNGSIFLLHVPFVKSPDFTDVESAHLSVIAILKFVSILKYSEELRKNMDSCILPPEIVI